MWLYFISVGLINWHASCLYGIAVSKLGDS